MDAATAQTCDAPQDIRTTTPSATDATFKVLSIVVLALTVLSYLLLSIFHAVAIPRFLAVFNDFDTELPALTIAVITVPGTVAFAGYMLALTGLTAKEFVPIIDNKVKLAMNVVALLLGALIFLLYFLGLFLPLVQLQESVM